MSRLRDTGAEPADLGRTPGSQRAAFVARLQEIVRHWPSADRLARAVGVSPSAFRKWLKGEAEPSRERLIALADAAGVGIAWLAKGEGAAPRFRQVERRAARSRDPGPEPGSVALDPENFLIVPKRTDVAAAGPPDAPNPVLPKEEYLAFRHDWLRWMFKVEPDDLVMEVAVGESMQPTINDGDVLLVHTGNKSISSFGIYILEIDGERLVKRVQKKLGGSLLLISDNPAYEPDLVPPEAARSLSVIGRVVWSGGAL